MAYLLLKMQVRGMQWIALTMMTISLFPKQTLTSGVFVTAFMTPESCSNFHVPESGAFFSNRKSSKAPIPFRRHRSLIDHSVASVERDLDAALDSLLGDAIDELSSSKSKREPSSIQHKDFDYNDRSFLSTSNPRWVQAGLPQEVIDVLSEKGITHFTPVQGEAFDYIYDGKDVIGRSRTGTGKTLAFGLPGLTRLTSHLVEKGYRDQTGRMKRGRPVSMLVLCPTRELARQVQEELAAVARPLGMYVDVFHGGVPYDSQARALRNGLDVLVGTPGRIIDHIDKGNLKLSECDLVVLDEADEMLNMGFADDVEVILDGLGSDNERKAQCLLFSATTPSWVKEIGQSYQSKDVIAIDATGEDGGARVANTVRHIAVKLAPGAESKRTMLEDIIAIEISKDVKDIGNSQEKSESTGEPINAIAAAAAAKKEKSNNAMQQKIFGKTIVFVETKREADELVSGNVFKSLTAQALHGDVGQKQRDATLNAFRAGAFNVLVATDVAARGIDIQDVDLVVQFDPPRDVDTYVHRSGRTGRAGKKGVSVLLFNRQQERDIVRIERDLGHGFKFELSGPPSTEAALRAAAKTSAVACSAIPDDTIKYFKDAADALLQGDDDATTVVAKCLAAISRRHSEVQSRSLITGELGLATVEMTNNRGRSITPGDVMFTVGKLSRMSRSGGDLSFDSDVGKIQSNSESGAAFFDMGVEDAKKLVEFSKDIDAGGAEFSILEELEVERDRHFGKPQRPGQFNRYGNNGASRGRYNGKSNGYQGRPRKNDRGGYQDNRRNNFHGQNRRSDHEYRGSNRGQSYRGGGGGGGGGNGRYSSGRGQNTSGYGNSGGGSGGGGRSQDSDGW